MGNKRKIDTLTVYRYILPGFIVYIFALIIPIVIAVIISLTNWRGGNKYSFIGIDNYLKVFNDSIFWTSFLHNLQFIIILFFTQVGLGFIVALILQSKKVYLKELHRRVIFMPAILSAMVVGMVWRLVYRTDIGFIAVYLKKIGLENWIIPWMDRAKYVIPGICIVLTWQFFGQFAIILTAGMQNVGSEILEAASIDGAGTFQRATRIVLPLLKPTISVCAIMCISGCMKMFDIIIAMSGGGPGTASMLTALYAYNTAFLSQKLGYSSAMAICMLILSLILIVLSRKLILGGKRDV